LARAPEFKLFDCQGTMSLPGSQLTAAQIAADSAAKRAMEETKAVADFYKKVFERNSIDGAGMTVLSSIHYGADYNNAFWNGQQMTYGDGDGNIFVDFTGSDDVICHELTHGVTQFSAQLAYKNEAGGLNESLSDVFGSMFRQWRAGQDVTKADWLIGRDIMGPGAKKRGFTCLRDLADPGAKHCLAAQPKHYKYYSAGLDPHFSSGIPNYAFYVAAMAVGGNSWDRVGKIWYRDDHLRRTDAQGSGKDVRQDAGGHGGGRQGVEGSGTLTDGTKMRGVVKIERIGGLGGFGLPGSPLHSQGEAKLADLSPTDQRTVDRLFAQAPPPADGAAPHQFRYRLTRHTDRGAETVEAPENEVPAALVESVRDTLD
jgi:hypothetical protein